MAPRQNVTVTGSRTTSGPGLYVVTTSGVTITLETWTHWPDSLETITIKDRTGAASPNITVKAPAITGGNIDGLTTIVMVNSNSAITFRPYKDGISWSASG